MKIAYPAKFEQDGDGRILVTFRDFPEAVTDGANMEEARAEALDLLNSILMFRMKYREEIPEPSALRASEELLVPDTDVALKIALYVQMKKADLKIADLTRLMGIDNREAQRILNPQHATRVSRMQDALAKVGARLVVEVEETAVPAKKPKKTRRKTARKSTARKSARRQRSERAA